MSHGGCGTPFLGKEKKRQNMRDNGLRQNGSFRSRVTLTMGHVATAPGVVGVEAQPLDVRCAHLCRLSGLGGA